MTTKTRTAFLAASLLLVAGMGWVILRRSDQGGPISSDLPTVSLEVRISRVETLPTGDHAHLILTAIFDQNGETPLRLEPPLVSLLATSTLTPVARYLGPMLPEPVLAGSEPTEVTLHYWLPLSDLKSPLTLDAAGRRYALAVPGR